MITLIIATGSWESIISETAEGLVPLMYRLDYHSSVTGFFSSNHAPNTFAIKYLYRDFKTE